MVVQRVEPQFFDFNVYRSIYIEIIATNLGMLIV